MRIDKILPLRLYFSADAIDKMRIICYTKYSKKITKKLIMEANK